MSKYPALFTPAEEGGFVVSFRDIPEAITEGDTLEQAQDMAMDALITAMDFYFEDGRTVPSPSKPIKGEHLVALPPSVSAKIALLNARLATGMRPVDLARKMHLKSQEMVRIFDLKHPTKIDTVAAALSCMGYDLEIRVKPTK